MLKYKCVMNLLHISWSYSSSSTYCSTHLIFSIKAFGLKLTFVFSIYVIITIIVIPNPTSVLAETDSSEISVLMTH